MSLTGYIVSVPVFCDSGFIVLSALNKAISRRTGISLAVLAVALASGLYATHVFVPPTPGPLAAAATLGADIGRVLMFGLIVSFVAAGSALLWDVKYCKDFTIEYEPAATNWTEAEPPPYIAVGICRMFVSNSLNALRSVGDSPS